MDSLEVESCLRHHRVHFVSSSSISSPTSTCLVLLLQVCQSSNTRAFARLECCHQWSLLLPAGPQLLGYLGTSLPSILPLLQVSQSHSRAEYCHRNVHSAPTWTFKRSCATYCARRTILDPGHARSRLSCSSRHVNVHRPYGYKRLSRQAEQLTVL